MQSNATSILDERDIISIYIPTPHPTFLVTGGAGSIGSALVRELLERYKRSTVRVFDSSDYLLSKLRRSIEEKDRIRCLLGNVQDYQRLEMAMKNVDYVFHLAAIKDISITEYNPIETIKTNIMGTVNLIECCLREQPNKVVNLSSDKAIGFTTLYGSTKYIGEQLILWGHQVMHPTIKFCNVRFGNVIETRGNVFEIWKEQSEKGIPLTITDTRMKRYFMNIDDATDSILEAFETTEGGETFIPDMEEFNITDLCDTDEPKIIGPRRGEKLREELMTEAEKKQATKVGNLWVIR